VAPVGLLSTHIAAGEKYELLIYIYFNNTTNRPAFNTQKILVPVDLYTIDKITLTNVNILEPTIFLTLDIH